MNTDRRVLVKFGVTLCVGLAAMAFASVVKAGATASSTRAVVFKLKARHGSDVSGTATLTAIPKGVLVVLRLRGPSLDNFPAHVHTGPCKREPTFANPRIWSGLNTVVNGKSLTTLTRTTLAGLRAKRHSINVHDPRTLGVVACGDIPRTS